MHVQDPSQLQTNSLSRLFECLAPAAYLSATGTYDKGIHI